MNSKQLSFFSAGLIVSGSIYFLVALILFYSTFTIGSQTLSEKENIDSLYFYSILSLLVITIIVIYKQFKLNRKALTLGIGSAGIMLLVAFIYVGTIYFKDQSYYQSFDKMIWDTAKYKPFNMAKTLAKSNSLIGLSRKEIINKLGYDKETALIDGQSLMYRTETNWIFFIDLKKDTAVKTYLGELDD